MQQIGVINITDTFDKETVIGFEALFNSMETCKHGVIWKNSTAYYYLHGIEETIKLENGLKAGTYKPRPPKRFIIRKPKVREACSIAFRDRVYQRSLNDNQIYPVMTNSFIQANCACQKGKGSDFARAKLDEYLHSFYRKHKRDGYVLQCDIHGYYPSMLHSVAEELFKSKLPQDLYQMVESVLHHQYEGDIGYNPGSQMIQILGISMLDGLDHFIKERLHIKYYLRYMDDFILIHENEKYLQHCRDEISKYLNRLSFELHPSKTRLYPISDGINTLGFTHKLTESGKVIRILNPKNVKNERRKLARLVAKSKRGEIPKSKVDQCFASWIAHAEKGNSYKLIQNMKKYYRGLWQ